MNNKYISQFVNSRDIRAHLNDIHYSFSVPEYAFLIWQCGHISLQQKHSEWKKLLRTTNSCIIHTGRHSGGYDLHDMIQKYMDAENHIIETFVASDSDAFYMGAYAENHQKIEFNNHFSTYKKAYDAILAKCKQEAIPRFSITKAFIDNCTASSSNTISATFSSNGEMIDIDYSGITDHQCFGYNIDILSESFSEMFFDIPIPFTPGDIVCSYDDQEPFVLTETVPWTKKANPNNRTNWKDHLSYIDMNASGYTYSKKTNGMIWNWAGYNLLDLEYYREDLTGEKRLLTAYSLFKKGRMNGDTLVKVCQLVTTETLAAQLYCSIDYSFDQTDRDSLGLGIHPPI